MKKDINLLIKRKTKQFSSKSFAMIMIGLVFIAGALYAGIALPSQKLSSIKASVSALDSTIEATSSIESDLLEKTSYNRSLTEQISSLEALGDTKTDVLSYIDAIEAALPTDANLTQLNFSEDNMYIIGIASGDAAIATLALGLRASGMFESVYVTNSTALNETQTTFTLSAALPFTLSSSSSMADKMDAELAAAQNSNGGE